MESFGLERGQEGEGYSEVDVGHVWFHNNNKSECEQSRPRRKVSILEPTLTLGRLLSMFPSSCRLHNRSILPMHEVG